MSEPGIAVRFRVEVHGVNLGVWTKCDGLAVEYEIFEYQEGGHNDFVHRLPGRRKYTNVKLTRPLDKDSEAVYNWISALVKDVKRNDADIVALGPDNRRVMSWHLNGVIPVKWTGPSLDAGGNQVATESLELAHNGFLEAG
jgi:phage tail-like protein